SLRLGAAGRAIGGRFDITPYFTKSIENLVIPRHVTAIGDFGLGSGLILSGNLTNAGRLLAVSSNSAVSTASFSAVNIYNSQGALLTSILPRGGFAGFATAVNDLSLGLTARDDIVNAGTISSAGNLTLAAGRSIVNASDAAVRGHAPLLQAINNLNLLSAQIVNSARAVVSQGGVS